MTDKVKTSIVEKILIVYGIPIICILGTLFHFIFNLLNGVCFTGVIAPVNESIWEHLKIAFFPIIAYWSIGYFIAREKEDISINKWIVSMTISAIVSMLFIITTFYTYYGIIGKSYVFIDIIIFVISIALGQGLGYYVYNNIKVTNKMFYISILFLIMFITLFAVFTYYPPRIPFFYDKSGQFYGIKK